jgi:ABC-type cobalamin/Fe3+-siderophores transport system ATPase subunit
MTGWIMWALSSFFRELGVVAEGMETIAQPLALTDRRDAPPLKLTEGRIEMAGLSHHYGRDSGGVQDINITVQPGERIGLVGRSGAGKSTLVKLILRFYDAETGEIRIDGQDIAQVRQDSLRRHIGVVQQDSSLLHRSVRENILYGRPDASEAEMIAAAKQAQAHEFILDLTDPEGRSGYDARVGERGVKLSGGQRQRITLARVILKDAPILLLDEATSALDSEVEAVIQETLYGMMAGKTVIAIAHRLWTEFWFWIKVVSSKRAAMKRFFRKLAYMQLSGTVSRAVFSHWMKRREHFELDQPVSPRRRAATADPLGLHPLVPCRRLAGALARRLSICRRWRDGGGHSVDFGQGDRCHGQRGAGAVF